MVHSNSDASQSSPLGTSSPRAASVISLTESAERSLRGALRSQEPPPLGMFLMRSETETQALERAIGDVCAEAHRLDLRAEELLISIKQAWRQLATLRARHLGDRDGDVLRHVVSRSIEVFFEERDTRTRSPR
jgi:hypothetical protein